MKQGKWLIAAGLCALLAGPPAALAQEDFGFMPKGGKTLLVELLGSPADAAAFRRIAGLRQDEAAWRAEFAGRRDSLSEDELETLAGYLAVNMPLAEGVLAEAQGEPTAALPPDGRELAWNYCQFCHSLFTSHLTQDRGVQGWLGTFETPFHKEIGMNRAEQETFARYSAVNMPMKFEAVPEDLRF